MADRDEKDGKDPRIQPAQIPLLDDIVDASELPKKPAPPRKPKRENLDLDLEPDPPRSLDLFAEPGAVLPEDDTDDDVDSAPDSLAGDPAGIIAGNQDVADDIDAQSDPFGIMENELASTSIDFDIAPEEIDAILGEDDDWLDEGQAAAVEPPSLPHARQQLKQEASKVVDHLVQEYSQEILRRLRDELTHLLDDMDLDDDKSEGPEQ